MIFWLRAETKANERRTALTPANAKKLIDAGNTVYVEKFEDRIFPLEDYGEVGCNIVERDAWKSADKNDVILGLKELPEDSFPLIHRHIFFAHVYKGQDGSREMLERFFHGKGKLYDLEFLINENRRRIAAFGKWAGYVGSAIAVDKFYHDQVSTGPYPSMKGYPIKDDLIQSIKEKQTRASKHPKSIVIGAKGRCGSGAIELLSDLDLSATEWDMKETSKGGPFKEILEHDIFINTVLMMTKIPPFLSKNIINEGSKLTYIADVSCDPTSDLNPIPLYEDITSWEEPFFETSINKKEIKILAVDNLPSVLPREASEDFSDQLIEHLINFSKEEDKNIVWNNALDTFEHHIEEIKYKHNL